MIPTEFFREMMILTGEPGAHAHLPVAPLVLSETPSETITTRIATKGEVVLIVAMFVNDPFLQDQAVASPPPKAVHMLCQTIEHLWSAEQATATQNVFPLRRALWVS